MKAFFKYAAIVVVVLVVAAGVAFGLMFGGLQESPLKQQVGSMRLITDGSFVRSTIAIIPAGPNEVVLVDAGLQSTGEAILAELSAMRLNADAVKAIFLTHGHPDHIRAAAAFPKARLMALAEEADLVAGRNGGNPAGLELDRKLRDGETVQIGSLVIRVYAIPGHTDGSAAYLIDGVLFLGDSADARTDQSMQSAHRFFSNNLGQNEESLRQLYRRLATSGLEVRTMAFAHSGVLQGLGLAPLAAWVRDNPG